jgi:hypothetical protein
MRRHASRGGVLALSLVVMLFVLTVVTSLLAVTAARARAVAREARRAQALALAESAVAAVQAQLASGVPAASVAGRLATGSYAAEVVTTNGVQVTGTGTALPLLGESVVVRIEASLRRGGGGWQLSGWREVEP